MTISTTEAEITSAAKACNEFEWIIYLLKDFVTENLHQ